LCPFLEIIGNTQPNTKNPTSIEVGFFLSIDLGIQIVRYSVPVGVGIGKNDYPILIGNFLFGGDPVPIIVHVHKIGQPILIGIVVKEKAISVEVFLNVGNAVMVRIGILYIGA